MSKFLRTSVVAIATAILSLLPAIQAQNRAPARASTGAAGLANLGEVDFENSCGPAVKAEFNRGVALLHSFWEDEAFLAFQRVASADPDCAIAYWGEAMTHFHQILAAMTPADIAAGTAELSRADRAQEKSPREAAYVRALHGYFDGYRSTDGLQHAVKYTEAMAVVAKTYPDDLEAQVFYALSLLASDPPSDVELVNPQKAVTILEPLFREHPNHPGIAHYLIHACDNPQMAREGLDAARHYAQVAPGAPHALHMPAHIFARIGLWQEDIASNVASKAASEAAGLHRGAESRLHAMEFLEYAYVQTGRFDEAKAIVAEARTIQPSDVDPRYPAMYSSVESRYAALLAIETKDWATAARLEALTNASRSGRETTLLARAEAAGHLGDAKGADETVRALNALGAGEAPASGSASAIETRAWAAFARGDLQEATALLRPLADRQEKIGKGEVEIPAREMLAEMLLLSGRPKEALGQYQQSLASDPNRFNGLLGAGEAAERAGDTNAARGYYRALVANSGQADGGAIRALQHAKALASE
jgi:tetratricopeptide (TPR) repeat protein